MQFVPDVSGQCRALEAPNHTVGTCVRVVAADKVTAADCLRQLAVEGRYRFFMYQHGAVSFESDRSEIAIDYVEVLGSGVDDCINHVLFSHLALFTAESCARLHIEDNGVGNQASSHIHVAGDAVIEFLLDYVFEAG